MLDIKRIRETPDAIRIGIRNKKERDRLDELLAIDTKRRAIIQEVEALKNKRNTVSQRIAELKKAKQNADELIADMKSVSERIKQLDDEQADVERQIQDIVLFIPNMPHESVPVGASPEENVEVRRWIPDNTLGLETPPDWHLLDHIELGAKLKILDFERGAKISGSGFAVYTDKGATLERALINFMLDMHITQHGYTEVMPPFVVNTDSMRGTGQIPKMSEDMYRCADDDLYLIPTAEVPLTNLYRDEVLTSPLPIWLCGYSACFRREAGSYGKQTKGFLRVHQFNKVELVKFTAPESSYDELERLTNDAENVLRALNIPYRVMLLCSGDMSFSSAKTYDIEVWSPAENAWLEASSCSNFEDFQARRANIRFKRDQQSKPEFVHTLNGSGLATSRLIVALLENNQTPEGKVVVPKALHRYTGFEIIG